METGRDGLREKINGTEEVGIWVGEWERQMDQRWYGGRRWREEVSDGWKRE